MAIHLSKSLVAQIQAHGKIDFPYECCGAMLGTIENGSKIVRALMPAENVHEDGHERRFLIDAKTTLLLEKQERAGGLRVLGYYHSHPNHPARPSQYDLEAAWPGYSYLILSVMNGEPAEMTCWVLNQDGDGYDSEEILGGK